MVRQKCGANGDRYQVCGEKARTVQQQGRQAASAAENPAAERYSSCGRRVLQQIMPASY